MRVFFCMETPLRGCSGGHTGAAPTVSFRQITRKRLISFVWDVWKNITERGRGGAYVPARVAPQGRIRRSSLRTMRAFLVWKRRCADVRAGT